MQIQLVVVTQSGVLFWQHRERAEEAAVGVLVCDEERRENTC